MFSSSSLLTIVIFLLISFLVALASISSTTVKDKVTVGSLPCSILKELL